MAGEVRKSLSSQAVVSTKSSFESPGGTGCSGHIQDASDANSAPCFCERFHGPKTTACGGKGGAAQGHTAQGRGGPGSESGQVCPHPSNFSEEVADWELCRS